MGSHYNQRARASKQLQLISVPQLIVTASNTPVKVGKGSLCRIEGAADQYVRFAVDGDTTVPTSSTPETIETEAGFFYVIATEDFIIASASMRVEVTKD